MDKDDRLKNVVVLPDDVIEKDIAVLESLKTSKIISKAANTAKAEIAKHDPDPPEQGVFSFLPTTLTRVSPFFPLSKKDKNRTLPPEGLIWENSWGILTMRGHKLSIYDESLLLACLVLMTKYRKESFGTTRYELCKVMGVAPGTNTYKAIWESIEYLTSFSMSLKVWKPGTGKQKKRAIRMVNTILTGAMEEEDKDKITITINPYFLKMYAENLITGINLKLRSNLKGDITKALYRFLRSQKGTTYTCHVLTLCSAINLDVTRPLKTLKNQIKTSLTELKKNHYLSKSMVNRYDVVKIWKYTK